MRYLSEGTRSTAAIHRGERGISVSQPGNCSDSNSASKSFTTNRYSFDDTPKTTMTPPPWMMCANEEKPEITVCAFSSIYGKCAN